VAALVFMANGATLIRPSAPSIPSVPGDYDTYYIVDHRSWTIPMSALFALFGAVYLGMTQRVPIRLRPELGWVQLAVMSIGVALIEAPHVVLSWTGIPESGDLTQIFRTWNRTASIGYMLLLGGLLLFVIALADGWLRRHRG
jgi:heme/copper-type cytochrome/quinol oxidase subunit 1